MAIKVAANRVKMDGVCYSPGVLTLCGDDVESVYTLKNEEPFVLWIGGEICVKRAGGSLRAYKNEELLTENNLK